MTMNPEAFEREADHAAIHDEQLQRDPTGLCDYVYTKEQQEAYYSKRNEMLAKRLGHEPTADEIMAYHGFRFGDHSIIMRDRSPTSRATDDGLATGVNL